MTSKSRTSTKSVKAGSSLRSKGKTSANGKNQHVVPQATGQWAVKSAGSGRVTSVHKTQAEAIEAAKRAGDTRSEVIIHGRSGRIKQSISKSPADELMLRVWKSTHKADPEPARG